MHEENSIFINRFTLKHKIKSICDEYYNNVNTSILKYGKLFNGLLLVSSIAAYIYLSLLDSLAKEKNITWYFILIITSLMTIIISTITTLSSFLFRKIFIQKMCIYSTYILFYYPFNNVIDLLTTIHGSSNVAIYLSYAKYLIRVIILMMGIVSIPDCYYIIFFHVLNSVIYKYFLNNPLGSIVTILEILFYFMISYFVTLQNKNRIYSNYLIKEKNKRYDNLIEHLNSGYISFKNKKINIINNFLIESLSRNSEIIRILEKEYLNEFEKKGINTIDKIQINFDQENTFKICSEKILEILLTGIINDYDQINKDELNYNVDSIHVINKDVAKIISNLRNLYFSQNMNEKFLFLGFKEILLDSNSAFCYTKLDYNNNQHILSQTIEKRIFEVYIRCHNRGSLEDDEYEIIMNDVSKVKLLEENSAELKYKTIFLTKVAHEFKNPLICISELVNEIQDKGILSIVQTKDTIKQLKSMSDYLLLLIKDLDYFSQLQMRNKDPSLEINEIDLDDTIEFSKQIAETLIFKFNKNRLKFVVENELNYYPKFMTDGIKLKQILVNLISNSIKFSNEGYVKLKIKMNDKCKIIFEVLDSGIGLSEKQILNINSPFNKGSFESNKYGSGLGLYIVGQMLIQMSSSLNIISYPGTGSSFSFCFDVLLEESESENTTLMLNSDYSINIGKDQLDNFRNIRDENEKRSLSVNYPKNSRTSFKNLNIIKEEPLIDHDIENIVVIDDEKIIRMATIKMIRRAALKLNKKINIFEAEDGIDGLYQVYMLIKNGLKIKAIVSDEIMNFVNGTYLSEIIGKINNINSLRIPFYLISALNNVIDPYVTEVLSKPINENIAYKILENKL